ISAAIKLRLQGSAERGRVDVESNVDILDCPLTEMANILAQKQLRYIILTHVIRAQRAINNEMAHQLYVLQVLTFNLLEDRMMTKMDPQDQDLVELTFLKALRKLPYTAEAGERKTFIIGTPSFMDKHDNPREARQERSVHLDMEREISASGY
ncbi:engulfment and cell motility protein 1 isoform X1, partial [Sigmodon hispidus]